jgi:poly(A) polymerase
MTQININFLPTGFPQSPEVYLVGGTVRDILLGKKPLDYDVVTTGDPVKLADQIAAIFKSRVIRLGKPGMTLYRVKSPENFYDIVPAFGGAIDSDLHQRDFTINAMAMRSSDGALVDLFNGCRDIHQKTIRMISRNNLISDPIRLLRAYRMGAALNFSIETVTRDSIREESHRINSSAPERIREELVKLVSGPSSSAYVKDMASSGILTAILPEMILLKKCLQNKHHPDDAFEHSLNTFSCLEEIFNHPADFSPDIKLMPVSRNIPLLKFAILIHDIGKPHTRSIDEYGNIHFYSHEKKSALLSGVITKRLRFSNKDQRYVHDIIANHMKPLFLFLAHRSGRLTPKAINRFFLKSNGYVMDILIHAMADMKAKGAHPDTGEFIKFSQTLMASYHHQFRPLTLQPPLINGDDLITEFGIPPSPLFGKILNHVEEQRLQRLIHSREEALIIAKKFLKFPSPVLTL